MGDEIDPKVRKTLERYTSDIKEMEPWENGGARVKIAGRITYSGIKRLNDLGHVVGGIFHEDDHTLIYVEPNRLGMDD